VKKKIGAATLAKHLLWNFLKTFARNRVPVPAGRQISVGLQTKIKLLSYLSCNQIWLHLYMNCCYCGYTKKVGKKNLLNKIEKENPGHELRDVSFY